MPGDHYNATENTGYSKWRVSIQKIRKHVVIKVCQMDACAIQTKMFSADLPFAALGKGNCIAVLFGWLMILLLFYSPVEY